MSVRLVMITLVATGAICACKKTDPDIDHLRDARNKAYADRSETAADRAETEADRAQREADRARNGRGAPDIARGNADADRARAEADRAQAEADRARAEADKARAEADKARAEADKATTSAPQRSSVGRQQAAIVNFSSGATHANLRGGPSRDTEKLAEVPRGSRVTLLGESRRDEGVDTGRWHRVSYGGTTGWLHENSLEIEQ